MANRSFPWERGVAALTLLALLGMPASAGGPVRGVSPSADPVNKELAEVIELFYDIQPEGALAAAQAVERRHPGHPAGPFYQAVVHYERSLFEDPVRPATLAAFDREAGRCISAAEAVRSSSPALGYYYLGAGHGVRARVRAHQGRMADALSDGKKAMRHLRAAAEADPGLEDAYLGLGMYNYFASRLPAAVKPFAFLLTGLWPDRKKGIEQIQRAAENGTLARVESRTVLASIYSSEREKRWDEAEGLLAPLMERYPRNPYFRLRRVYTAEKDGRWDDAVRWADPDGRWLDALAREVRDKTAASVRYRAAEALILSGRQEDARPQLEKLKDVSRPARLLAWIELRRANLLQADGRKDEAGDLYRHVMAVDETARKTAERFIKEPYPKGPKTVAPLRWPLSEVPR
ncbi:MAG: hypothetical protein HZB91_02530 [Elusimicrobia bacterium]|nr:hypothetical protein [Elusimicrobiota bacterium]